MQSTCSYTTSTISLSYSVSPPSVHIQTHCRKYQEWGLETVRLTFLAYRPYKYKDTGRV